MSTEYVIYNGIKMAAEWPCRIVDAQQKTVYVINGKEYPRIHYGDEAEDWGADRQPCHDCGVIKQQYHVPFLCDAERCPACGGQVISCDCKYEGDTPS